MMYFFLVKNHYKSKKYYLTMKIGFISETEHTTLNFLRFKFAQEAWPKLRRKG
jgi:hypothetical protein